MQREKTSLERQVIASEITGRVIPRRPVERLSIVKFGCDTSVESPKGCSLPVVFSAAPVSSYFDGMVIGGSLKIGGRTTLLVLFGAGNALSIIRQAFSGHQLEIEIGRNTPLL